VAVKLSRRGLKASGGKPEWHPIPTSWWVLGAVIVLLVTTTVVTGWLLVIASHAAPGTDRASAQLDAVRTGLAAGAGAAAGVGLMLAFRRQHHQEIATVLTDLDATEQRITELYIRATEQLGSEKAPVRLGGLYALERLAQDNPAHRQTVVYVICAYLRMPFPPAVPVTEQDIKDERLEEQRHPGPFPEQPFGSSSSRELWQQEREVRLTAQRILSNHLNSQAETFWNSMNVDLIGATLIEFDFAGCEVRMAAFNKATFVNSAWFSRSKFHHYAAFSQARFDGDAEFKDAMFEGYAIFDRCKFSRVTVFDGAHFMRAAEFGRAVFGTGRRTWKTLFRRSRFTGECMFASATFKGAACFDEAVFDDRATFDSAEFLQDCSFDKAAFGGTMNFDSAEFARAITFAGARIISSSSEHTVPTGWRLNFEEDEGTLVRTPTALEESRES